MPNIRRRDVFKLAGGLASLAIGQELAPRFAMAQDARTLTIAWDTDIDTLDPTAFKSIGAYVVQANVYDNPLMWQVDPVAGKPGLYRSQPGEFQGSAVESWSFRSEERRVGKECRSRWS